MPWPGSKSFDMMVLRCGEFAISQAEESVSEAPKPVMVWYVADGLTVIV